MGSLDDALQEELKLMQQRLLSALQLGDEHLQQFLFDWNHLKEQLVYGLSNDLISPATKQLAADVARPVALIAQSFLNLEQKTASLLADTSSLSKNYIHIRDEDEGDTDVDADDTDDEANSTFESAVQRRADTKHSATLKSEEGLSNRTPFSHLGTPAKNGASSTSVVTTGEKQSPLAHEATSAIKTEHVDSDDSEDENALCFYPRSEGEDEDADFDVLRDWMLANIAAPFVPTGQAARDLRRAAQVDSDELAYWIESTRKICGWEALLNQYAQDNTEVMRDLCTSVFQEIDENSPVENRRHSDAMISDFSAMREHVRSFKQKEPSLWWGDVQQLFAEIVLGDSNEWDTASDCSVESVGSNDDLLSHNVDPPLSNMSHPTENSLASPCFTSKPPVAGKKRGSEEAFSDSTDHQLPTPPSEEVEVKPRTKRRRLEIDTNREERSPSVSTMSFTSATSQSSRASSIVSSSSSSTTRSSSVPNSPPNLDIDASTSTYREYSAPSDYNVLFNINSPSSSDGKTHRGATESSIATIRSRLDQDAGIQEAAYPASQAEPSISNHTPNRINNQNLDIQTIRSSISYTSRKRKRKTTEQQYPISLGKPQTSPDSSLYIQPNYPCNNSNSSRKPPASSDRSVLQEQNEDQPSPCKKIRPVSFLEALNAAKVEGHSHRSTTGNSRSSIPSKKSRTKRSKRQGQIVSRESPAPSSKGFEGNSAQVQPSAVTNPATSLHSALSQQANDTTTFDWSTILDSISYGPPTSSDPAFEAAIQQYTSPRSVDSRTLAEDWEHRLGSVEAAPSGERGFGSYLFEAATPSFTYSEDTPRSASDIPTPSTYTDPSLDGLLTQPLAGSEEPSSPNASDTLLFKNANDFLYDSYNGSDILSWTAP